MATEIKPELSKKSKYWLPKHRYYELLHWCRQYDDWWKKKLDIITTINSVDLAATRDGISQESYIEKAVEKLEKINFKIQLLNKTVKDTDSELADYILLSVTKGKGYTYLKEMKNIPCSKNYYYDKYRKFFWLLDKKLG